LLTKIEIEDDLAAQNLGAIEVTVHLADGTRRWCFFMTSSALCACGDWINGTTIRFHYAPHMIIVAGELSREIIEEALREIDRRGDLQAATRPLLDLPETDDTAI
jgi:hypothetical protein